MTPRVSTFLLSSFLLAASSAAAVAPIITFNGDARRPAFVVEGWSGGEPKTAEEWQTFFSVFVEQQTSAAVSGVPPLGGSYRVDAGTLVFQPRYPLQPGLHYRAVLRGAGNHTPPAEVITKTFAIAKPEAAASTVVEQVYPSTNRVPENQLKFYLHFSAPMSRGEAYRRIHLLDSAGQPIPLPFLEIDQELWDREGRRLTLLFDPGRVKRDLLPNREAGSPLREGESYTLVVDREWLDAAGNPLRQEFRKPFQAGAPDYDPPSTQNWKVTAPAAQSTDALVIQFPEPLDYALLSRVIQVTTPTGDPVEGSIELDREETRWQFRPREPWRKGDYVLEVATLLEDLAGNSLDRPFEVDVFEKVEEKVAQTTRTIRFTVSEEEGK